MFGRGRWQTIIRFSSFIVHADAIYAISLLWVPTSSLFSCFIEGCCDTAIQGRDCRGQHCREFAAKSALVKKGSVTLMKRRAVRQWFETRTTWHGSSSKCNLENNSWRGETLICTSLSFVALRMLDIVTSLMQNDHQRGYVMFHVRQYIPIPNSINKDVGPLNLQNPIRWIFGRTSNHLLDSGWLHCSSCPEVTLATSITKLLPAGIVEHW